MCYLTSVPAIYPNIFVHNAFYIIKVLLYNSLVICLFASTIINLLQLTKSIHKVHKRRLANYKVKFFRFRNFSLFKINITNILKIKSGDSE